MLPTVSISLSSEGIVYYSTKHLCVVSGRHETKSIKRDPTDYVAMIDIGLEVNRSALASVQS